MNGDFYFKRFAFPADEILTFSTSVMQIVDMRPELFDINTLREKYAPALSETRTIHLRNPKLDPAKNTHTRASMHVLDCIDAPTLVLFPMIKPMIDKIGSFISPDGFKHHGRYFITMLKQGQQIGFHTDAGAYFKRYRRLHIPLRVTNECFFLSEGQKQMMSEGELWELNNVKIHSVDNSAGNDRYHLIFDVI